LQENFQIQVIDKCEKPQQFCAELVDTVHQLPDGKRLPQDRKLGDSDKRYSIVPRPSLHVQKVETFMLVEKAWG
jgi:hypothetical protein